MCAVALFEIDVHHTMKLVMVASSYIDGSGQTPET